MSAEATAAFVVCAALAVTLPEPSFAGKGTATRRTQGRSDFTATGAKGTRRGICGNRRRQFMIRKISGGRFRLYSRKKKMPRANEEIRARSIRAKLRRSTRGQCSFSSEPVRRAYRTATVRSGGPISTRKLCIISVDSFGSRTKVLGKHHDSSAFPRDID
jgi:hypothetical protein